MRFSEWSSDVCSSDLINGEAGLGRFIDGADVDVDSRDIFEHLDLGAMIHGEVRHRSGFGAIVDYSFMDLSGKSDGPVVPGAEIKAEVFQGVLEAFASYRFDLSPAQDRKSTRLNSSH